MESREASPRQQAGLSQEKAAASRGKSRAARFITEQAVRGVTGRKGGGVDNKSGRDEGRVTRENTVESYAIDGGTVGMALAPAQQPPRSKVSIGHRRRYDVVGAEHCRRW